MRRRFRQAVLRIATLLAVLAGPVGASAAPSGGEVLFVYPPDGWKLALETRVGKIRFTEYVPAGQSVEAWSEMITVQVVENSGDLSATDVARRLRTQFIAECGQVRHRGPERLNVGGYLAARLYLECTDPISERRPGGARYRKHEVAAYQVIQGKSDLYVIERAWHGDNRSEPGAPYGRADVWGWDGFLHAVEICDGARRDRPCFGLGLLSAERADIFVSQADPVLPYGCDYFRVLTLLPDLERPARPTVVVPLKLGRGPFGRRKGELKLVDELVGAYQQNRPAAVILTLSRGGRIGVFRNDVAKTARDAVALRSLLTQAGVSSERIHETVNPACAGS